MWVVMRIQPFEVEPTNFPLPISVDARKMKGYLPVYETMEDAKAEFPDGPFGEIQYIPH